MPGHHARFVHPVRCKKNVRHAAQGASEAASSVSGRTCRSSRDQSCLFHAYSVVTRRGDDSLCLEGAKAMHARKRKEV